VQKEKLKIYENKRVFLILKNGLKYTGVIVSVDDDAISFRDKFNISMLISFNDISLLQEQPRGRWWENEPKSW